jgi:hypothetical protein
MSAVREEPLKPSDAVAGLLASLSILVGAIGVAHTPVVIIPATILLALVAARMSDRFRTLAAWAVGLNVVWWILGMSVAVITESPLF